LEQFLSLEQSGSDSSEIDYLAPKMYGRTYSGQLLANALTASMLTAKWQPDAMHGFFVNPGSTGAQVKRVRGDRHFSCRTDSSCVDRHGVAPSVPPPVCWRTAISILAQACRALDGELDITLRSTSLRFRKHG